MLKVAVVKGFLAAKNWVRPAVLLASTVIFTLPEAEGRAAVAVGRTQFNWEAVDSPLVSGYKVHWGTESGVYTRTFDAGNITEVVVEEFFEGVTYYSAVTAYSATGDESDFSEEIAFVCPVSTKPPPAKGKRTGQLVLLDVEQAETTSTMDVSEGYIMAAYGDTAATATLAFETLALDDYYVWCRVYAPFPTTDSFLLSVNGGPELPYHVHGEPNPPPSAYQPEWIWSRMQISPGVPRPYALEAGPQTLRFRNSGLLFINRMILVGDPDFVPTDDLPLSGDYVAVLENPQGGDVAAGGSMTLEASVVATGPLEFQWIHNGEPLGATAEPSLDLLDVDQSDGGDYSLVATVRTASASSSSAMVNVVAPGNAFRVGKMSVAAGNQVTFDVVGASGSQIAVYVSSDLIRWDLLATVPNAGEPITVTDPGAEGQTQRYYRLGDLGQSSL